MGIFDDLVGGEGKDEELQDNIEEIRDRVQGERPGRNPPRQEEGTGEAPIRPDEVQEGREEPPEPRPPIGGEEQGRGSEAREPEGTTTQKPDRGRRSERGQRTGSEPETEGPTHEDVPEPPEVKDIDVPDIEKGPLFITVDKFKDALDAVSDLRRVAADMENYIGSMEGTLQEDRDTEEGVREILDEAEEDTEDLKDIVSP